MHAVADLDFDFTVPARCARMTAQLSAGMVSSCQGAVSNRVRLMFVTRRVHVAARLLAMEMAR